MWNFLIKRPYFFILIPLFIYVAGINPYLATDTYDNTDYFEAIRNFVATGTYLSKEGYSFGWAPGAPFLLSIPGWLDFPSIWFIKAEIILISVASLILLYYLFSLEKRPHGFISLFMFSISPLALLHSSRILSEWPFFMWSTIFLICYTFVERKKPPLPLFTFLSAISLIAAILTRYIGLLLLVSVTTRSLIKIWNSRKSFRLKSFLPELLIIGAGCLIYVLWQNHLNSIQSNLKYGFDYKQQIDNFLFFDILGLLFLIPQHFFSLHVLFQNQIIINVVSLLVGTVLTLGWVSLWKKKKICLSDHYVVAYLVVISFYKYKINRYVFPVSPFLFCYFFEGLKVVYVNTFLSRLNTGLLKRGLLFIWISFFLLVDFHLLLLGNGKSYNGLNFLISKTPEYFYKGNFLDLYKASRFLSNDKAPGHVFCITAPYADHQYVRIFSNRTTSNRLRDEVYFLFLQKNLSIPIPIEQQRDFTLVGEFGNYRILKRQQPHHPGGN